MYLTDADILYFFLLICNMMITSFLLLSFFLVLMDSHYEARVTLVGIPDQLLISRLFTILFVFSQDYFVDFFFGNPSETTGR